MSRHAFERPKSVEAAVLETLKNMIASGELAPGQPIRQDEIAAELGVSRVPVRESLKILMGEGQVQHVPRQGFRVVALKIEDLFDIYRMRELLESEALAYGVPNLTDAMIEDVRVAMHEIEARAGADIMDTIDANQRFHLTPIEASNKPVLSRTIRILWETATPFAIRLILSTEIGVIHAEHREIFQALRVRDTETVIKAFSEHREASLKRIRTLLSSDPHRLDPVPTTIPS